MYGVYRKRKGIEWKEEMEEEESWRERKRDQCKGTLRKLLKGKGD